MYSGQRLPKDKAAVTTLPAVSQYEENNERYISDPLKPLFSPFERESQPSADAALELDPVLRNGLPLMT